MTILTERLTPGLAHFIQRIIPQYGTPLAAFWAMYEGLVRSGYHDHIPKSLLSPLGLALVSAGAYATHSLFWSLWDDHKRRQEMRLLNARPIPRAGQGRLPGNLDTLYMIATTIEKEYPGYPIVEWKDTHGDIFCLRLLGEEGIYTDNPAYIKELLATNHTNFVKGPFFREAARSMLGNGIFNSNGEDWKFHRAMTRPFFSRDRVTDFDIFDRHAKLTIEKIRERCCGETRLPIDIQDIVSRFTMDCATEFLIGKSANSLDSPLPLPGGKTVKTRDINNQFASAFQSALQLTMSRQHIQPTSWQMTEIFGDRAKPHMKILYAFIDPMIDEAIEKRKRVRLDPTLAKEEDDANLLSHLVAVTEDRTILRDELINILMAGRDTTAATLTFVMYFLALHPYVRRRLRREVLDALGSSQECLTFDQLKELKYMRAVINETLRLLPPVPFNVREAVKPTVFVNPKTGVRYYVPPGRVVYSMMSMHRDFTLWGPDALEFDPDRWLDERHAKYFLANPFIFLPFSAGPRICLGQQFAYNEASYFVGRFLQAFQDVELAPDAQPEGSLPPKEWKESTGSRKSVEQFVPRFHITLYAKGGLWMRIPSGGGMQPAE